MWLDLAFSQASRSVEQNVNTTFAFPNLLSESEELQSWGCSKILLSFLMRFDRHFDQISNSSNVYLSSSRFWTATSLFIFYQFPSVSKSRIPPKNIWSQIDQLWNKILWQISVHFRHPWRIKKTDFTRQVITCTLSEINKGNSVCERMLVDST